MNHTGDIAATRKASRALRSAAEQAANGREEDASDVQAEEVEATQTRPKPEPEIPPYAHMQDRPAGFWAKRFLARIPKPWRGTVQQVADGMPQLVSMASRRRVASSRQNWEIEDPGLDVLLWEAMEEITLINQELDLGMSFSHFVAVADLLRGNPMVVMHYLTMHCDEGQTHFGSINDEHNNTIRRASKAASAICSCSTSYFIGWSRRPIVRRPCSGYLVALCLLCVAF